MSVETALARANAALEFPPATIGSSDLRWRTILDLARYVETDPESIWRFVARWGCAPDENLRGAVATCLLEGLLEYHFEKIFDRVAKLALQEPLFASTVELCWRFAEGGNPDHLTRLRELQEESRQRRAGS